MALITNIKEYHEFDDNTGSTARDATGNGFDGTWQGTLGSQWSSGIIGNAGNFNGTDNYTSKTSASLGLGTSITISLWTYLTTNTAASYYCWYSFGGFVAGGFILQKSGDNTNLRFAWNGTDYYDGAAFTATNSWHHLVVVVSGGVPATFYDNNVATTAVRGLGTGTFSATDPKDINIGRRNDATQFVTGKIDEVAVWNRALSSSEVSQIYNNGAGLQYPFVYLPAYEGIANLGQPTFSQIDINPLIKFDNNLRALQSSSPAGSGVVFPSSQAQQPIINQRIINY